MINQAFQCLKKFITQIFPEMRKSGGEILAQSIPNIFCKVANDGSAETKIYLNDPSTPELIAIELVPKNTLLPINSVGDQGGGFPVGSIQQQASACKGMINNILTYLASKSQKPITSWSAVKTLTIMPRAGKDINAFYDRGSLKFFFFGDPVTHKAIYACDARPVVTHEFGHAFLDILRPDFWSAQAPETWAFHEAFGDITAFLAFLQYDELIELGIAETNGDLLKSNILSRMAVDMGIGLYHVTQGKNGELPHTLRDLSIVFNYTEPEKLPSSGKDNVIVNESHSFSRIFSGTFYEMVIKFSNFNVNQGMPQKEAIKAARDVAASYILSAIPNVPNCVRLFDAICRQMLHLDKANGGKYQEIMMEIFNSRNLIRPQIMMLEDVTMGSVVGSIKEPYEVQVHGDTKIVRTLSTKTIKMVDHLGLIALEVNPLFNLEIEVPNQNTYYFDKNDKLTGTVTPNDAEIFDAAYNCLHILNDKNLVGTHETALFEDKFGKLVRKRIVCVCNRPNYCDPNAPEYGKPWKPANNSGCTTCRATNCQPRSCDCNSPPPPTPVKLGCYVKVRNGQGTTYRFGQSISRKVC